MLAACLSFWSVSILEKGFLTLNLHRIRLVNYLLWRCHYKWPRRLPRAAASQSLVHAGVADWDVGRGEGREGKEGYF